MDVCRAAFHQSIVLSCPQGPLVHESLTINSTFSSPQSIPAASISNANFGVFTHHHYHLALRMAHNEFVLVDELSWEKLILQAIAPL